MRTTTFQYTPPIGGAQPDELTEEEMEQIRRAEAATEAHLLGEGPRVFPAGHPVYEVLGRAMERMRREGRLTEVLATASREVNHG